jgi:hypothetical protein
MILGTFKVASDPNDRMALASAIAGFPPALRSSEAVKAAVGAIISGLDSSDFAERAQRAEELAALAPTLTIEQATTAKESVLRNILTTTDPTQRRRFVSALARLPILLTSEQIATISNVVRAELAATGKAKDGEVLAQAISGLLRSRPEAEHVAEVIELLKYPTAAGAPSAALLAGLRERFTDAPADGANLREFVAWIRTRFPTLAAKLGQPPVRPHS